MNNNVLDCALGGELNPVSNNRELRQAITGRKNCNIYTKGTFPVTKENLYELEIRNIKLVGLSFARFSKEQEKVDLKVDDNIISKGFVPEVNQFETRYINGSKS